jgi:hypothetical protein
LDRAGFSIGLLRRVEAGHVGLVVLFVVQGHDFLGDVGLQRLRSGRCVKTRGGQGSTGDARCTRKAARAGCAQRRRVLSRRMCEQGRGGGCGAR